MKCISRGLFAIAAVAALTHCGPVKFTGQDASSPITTNVNGGGPNPSPPPVCDPFGGGPATPGHGLKADLYYLTGSQTQNPFNNVDAYITQANGHSNAPLFLNDINVPTRYFVSGFTDASGQQLTDSSGNVITEYFAIQAKSNFVLGNWAPGDYQLAMLSDDGSIMTIQNAQGNNGVNTDGTFSDYVINNDGTHSTKMGCSNQYVHLDANSQLPLTLKYYQGPRVSIAMLLLARPLPPGNPQDDQCGHGFGAYGECGGSTGISCDTYFFNDHNYPQPAVAQQPYNDLLSRGWQVVDGSHFVLPGNQQNPCAP